MRKYHRWLSVIFGAFLLWISATGLLSQVGSLVNNGGFEKESRPAAATPAGNALIPAAQAHEQDEMAPPVAFKCPAEMVCRPKPKPTAWNVGMLHHLHSGEQFGPAGVVISMMSGLALFFFAFSGLWMYIQMFRARSKRQRAEHPLFWK